MDLKASNDKVKAKAPPKPRATKKHRNAKIAHPEGGPPYWWVPDYEYVHNEAVKLNEEGLKQITDLKKEHYRITRIYESSLGDMTVFFCELEEEDDTNIRNPYLLNHWEPVERDPAREAS